MTHNAEDMYLVPERSVPVSGFSRDLRLADDVQRFRFLFALRGEAAMPVHIVFSPTLRVAEVKTGDMKVLRLADVASPEDARERWVAWWKAGGGGKPRFVAPRRAGRYPAPQLARA